MKKNALGKGLGALIPDADIQATRPDSPLKEVPVGSVSPNRFQPRNVFDDAEIRSLADSIKENGLLQPVIVRSLGSGAYEIISGERRFRAMKLLGYDKIPIIEKVVESDRQMLVMALIENLQRENLNPIEEALGYRQLIEDNALTQQEVSRVVSKSRVHVTNTLRLLNLEPEIISAIENNSISAGHGRALLSFGEKQTRLRLFRAITEKGLSVRELEKMASGGSVKAGRAKSGKSKSPMILDLEEKMQEKFGTKVAINHTSKGGSITIKYYGNEDLTRIMELLDVEAD